MSQKGGHSERIHTTKSSISSGMWTIWIESGKRRKLANNFTFLGMLTILREKVKSRVAEEEASYSTYLLWHVDHFGCKGVVKSDRGES